MIHESCPHVRDGGAHGLDTYQQTLSVSLIATPRERIVTCTPDDSISETVRLASSDGYDHIPVAVRDNIVGIVNVGSLSEDAHDKTVKEAAEPLSEKHLIGAGTSILDFIEQAEKRPFRLLVTDRGISGLVSISDLQQLASRASLFALVTQLEISMMETIRKSFPGESWRPLIDENRLSKALGLWEMARDSSRQVDLLTYTQFCDKASIIESLLDSLPTRISRREFRTSFERFRRLRDALAHANPIEASPKTCQTVSHMREWIEMLEWQQELESPTR